MTIATVREIAATIRELVLVPADGERLSGCSAGAHVECEVSLPDGGVARRAYSLVNRPGETDAYRIAVARDDSGRGGSIFMHAVQEGGIIRVEEPRNDFPLVMDAAESLLVAGGIGITPIIAMAHALRHAGRPFELHYVGRRRDVMAYADEVEAMPGATLVCDGGDPARGLAITELVALPRPGRHLYVCGPRRLIDAILLAAAAAGWQQDCVHFELFGADAPQSADRAFTVEFARSGKSAIVPVGGTILEVMEALGLDPLFYCRRGECGICVADVLEGDPDHRDMNLSEREKSAGKLICTCVSRARGDRLVLDA